MPLTVTYCVTRQGYAIRAVEDDGAEGLIVCGNHPTESAGFISPADPRSLSYPTLRRFCMQTLQEEYPGIKAKMDRKLEAKINETRIAMAD